LFINYCDDYATVFKTKEELDQMEETEKSFYRDDWKNREEWDEATEYLDHDSQIITTPKGEVLEIVCAYGRDG